VQQVFRALSKCLRYHTSKSKLILISKSQIKLITSLSRKKYRDQLQLFVAEGPKVIAEFIAAGLELHLFFSSEMLADQTSVHHQITPQELKKISSLKNPNTALAVFKFPKQENKINQGLKLMLDGIQDPGNLGTIIRLADWFGVTQIVCSKDTVDCYNSKVVQATMGSLARVAILYCDLNEVLSKTNIPVYGGVLNGVSVYKEKIAGDCYIVVGNEGNGVSDSVKKQLTHQITIPQFGITQDTESLNVATATAILLSEAMRPTGK